jgi:FtsP/CotA-like multicopper oxidase with cupredoxin domain
VPARLRAPALAATARRAKPVKFTAALRIPQVITGVEIDIAMREADVAVLPGQKTRMWTYNGTFPGPTIRRPAGERTQVTFDHQLPNDAGELTVHLHGGHNTSADDGQPGGLTQDQPQAFYCQVARDLTPKASGSDLLIAPGANRTYEYSLVEDGSPERASFQWYHDHRLERTGRNVWKGLAGMWILDDDLDSSLPLPTGDRDIPLMIVDRAFTRDNQLTDPFGAHAHAPNDGISGPVALVNGVNRPRHEVSASRYRLRILNASNFTLYDLELSNGAPMVQIATESGLMPHPIKRKRIRIGPAERVEVIVDFRHDARSNVELVSVPHGSHGSVFEKIFNGPLMQFRVGRRASDTTSVPSTLRPLPYWVASASPNPSKTWDISISSGLIATWLINGKTFDPARSDAFPELDTTVTWQLRNSTAVTHVMHLHATDWHMLSRNGKRPKPWEQCLKESFLIEPDDTIVVAGHFSDYTGKYVIHCHMLDHEDHGLMSQFEVVAS